MGNDGNGAVHQFPKNIPIIGQPFTLKNFFTTVQIVCNCEGKEPVLLVGNGFGRCPACARVFQLQGIRANPKGGLEFAIGLVTQTPGPEPDAAPPPAV